MNKQYYEFHPYPEVDEPHGPILPFTARTAITGVLLALLAATLTLCSCSSANLSYNHLYGNQKKVEKSRKHAVNKFNNRRNICIRTFQ